MNRLPSSLRNIRTNTLITNTCIGTALSVYTAWKLTEPGPVTQTLEPVRASLSNAGIPTPSPFPNTRLRQTLNKYFVLNSKDPKNYPSWIGAAFSHQGLTHLAFNLITWSSFSAMLHGLPPIHTLGIIFGSAIAASGAFLYDGTSRNRSSPQFGLGSSGIVSGVLMTCTLFAPMARASIMGIIPAPLVALTGGYFLMDSYFVQSGQATGVGHSAHLGGGLFAAVYYAVFLRRFGGVLGRVGVR